MRRAAHYPPELRQRAMRLVREHRGECPSEWGRSSRPTANWGQPPRRCGCGSGGTRSTVGGGRGSPARSASASESGRPGSDGRERGKSDPPMRSPSNGPPSGNLIWRPPAPRRRGICDSWSMTATTWWQSAAMLAPIGAPQKMKTAAIRTFLRTAGCKTACVSIATNCSRPGDPAEGVSDLPHPDSTRRAPAGPGRPGRRDLARAHLSLPRTYRPRQRSGTGDHAPGAAAHSNAAQAAGLSGLSRSPRSWARWPVLSVSHPCRASHARMTSRLTPACCVRPRSIVCCRTRRRRGRSSTGSPGASSQGLPT